MRIATEFTGRVQLSVFPYLLERLIHTRHEPTADLSALSRIIMTDPVLCFMAMCLDRSMAPHSQAVDYDPPGVEAVMGRIGLSGIDAITSQALTDQALNGVHHHQAMALEWLWRHALKTALLAQGLALALDYRPAEQAYVAGLLHDIGKLALFSRTPAACCPMLADPTQAGQLLEAEEQVVGSDHGRIGKRLIQSATGAWFAADAARYHMIAAAEVMHALPLVRIVWTANRLAGQVPSSDAFETVAGLFNLSARQLNHLSATAEKQVEAAAQALGVVADAPVESAFAHGCTVPLGQEVRTSTVLSGVYGDLLVATHDDTIFRILQQSLATFLDIETLIMLNHVPHDNALIGRFRAGRVLSMPIHRLRIPLTASKCLPAICHANGEAVDSFSRAHQEKLTVIDQQLMAYMQKDGFVCMPVRAGMGEAKTYLLLGIDSREWPWIEQQAPLLRTIVAAVAGALEREQQRGTEGDSRAAERLASTVSRTRKIVHEINNPLSVIKNYLKVLTLRGDGEPSSKEELRIIDEEINRLAGLIRSLTVSPDKVPMRRVAIDVNATIMDILTLFRKGLPVETAIRLNQDLDDRIPAIPVDRDRFKQALMNLLKNAMEAMPGGGSIQVSTRVLRGTHPRAGSQDAASRVKISVCDDGPGIDEDIENDLFKPHVSSKTGHDGLGLSIVREAMTHLKGSLLYESTPGRGTCFHIELPTGKIGS